MEQHLFPLIEIPPPPTLWDGIIHNTRFEVQIKFSWFWEGGGKSKSRKNYFSNPPSTLFRLRQGTINIYRYISCDWDRVEVGNLTCWKNFPVKVSSFPSFPILISYCLTPPKNEYSTKKIMLEQKLETFCWKKTFSGVAWLSKKTAAASAVRKMIRSERPPSQEPLE